MNQIRLITLDEKHPVESIQYIFETGGNIPDEETLNQNPVAYLVDKETPSINIPGMIVSTSFSDTNKTISVWVRGGETLHTYKIVGFVDVASGRRYYFGGVFHVTDLKVPLPPSSTFVGVGTLYPQSARTLVSSTGTLVSLLLDYASSSAYEVSIKRAWLVVDDTPVLGIKVTDKTAGSFVLTAPVDDVTVFWGTEILSQ